MLDDAQTSQEAKEAIVKRPGVVESIVATATRALPPAEEAALQARGCDLDQTTENSVSAQNATKALVGLGREGISEAAKAVVGVLEDNDDWAKKQAVRSRRPVVLWCFHFFNTTRVHQTRSWVVSFSSLRPFGPRRATAMLRAGDGDDAHAH